MNELKDQVVTSFRAGQEAVRTDFERRPPWVMPALVVVFIVAGRISDTLLARHTSFNVIERYGISIIVAVAVGVVFLNALRMLPKRGSTQT
jgi:hypothetical protein